MNSLFIGQLGESIAANYLQQEKFTIRDRNVKLGYLELDLVAQKNDIIYFFEIKTRTNIIHIQQDTLISKKQLRNLKRAATLYLQQRSLFTMSFLFNLIIIQVSTETRKANLTIIPHIL